MTEKMTEAQKEQARIVAEQEEAQSAQPYPTQAQNDRAKLATFDDDEKVDKTTEAEKAPAGYKTRASKAD